MVPTPAAPITITRQSRFFPIIALVLLVLTMTSCQVNTGEKRRKTFRHPGNWWTSAAASSRTRRPSSATAPMRPRRRPARPARTRRRTAPGPGPAGGGRTPRPDRPARHPAHRHRDRPALRRGRRLGRGREHTVGTAVPERGLPGPLERPGTASRLRPGDRVARPAAAGGQPGRRARPGRRPPPGGRRRRQRPRRGCGPPRGQRLPPDRRGAAEARGARHPAARLRRSLREALRRGPLRRCRAERARRGVRAGRPPGGGRAAGLPGLVGPLPLEGTSNVQGKAAQQHHAVFLHLELAPDGRGEGPRSQEVVDALSGLLTTWTEKGAGN